MPSFVEIRPVGAELFLAKGWAVFKRSIVTEHNKYDTGLCTAEETQRRQKKNDRRHVRNTHENVRLTFLTAD